MTPGERERGPRVGGEHQATLSLTPRPPSNGTNKGQQTSSHKHISLTPGGPPSDGTRRLPRWCSRVWGGACAPSRRPACLLVGPSLVWLGVSAVCVCARALSLAARCRLRLTGVYPPKRAIAVACVYRRLVGLVSAQCVRARSLSLPAAGSGSRVLSAELYHVRLACNAQTECAPGERERGPPSNDWLAWCSPPTRPLVGGSA